MNPPPLCITGFFSFWKLVPMGLMVHFKYIFKSSHGIINEVSVERERDQCIDKRLIKIPKHVSSFLCVIPYVYVQRHSSLKKSGTTQKNCIELPENPDFPYWNSFYMHLQNDISVYSLVLIVLLPPFPFKVVFTDIIYTWRGDPCTPRSEGYKKNQKHTKNDQ